MLNRKQLIISLLLSAYLAFFSLEGFTVGAKNKMYMLGGLAGAAIVLFYIFYKKRYSDFDTFLFLTFFSLGWISSIVAYGLSVSFFFSKFICAWMAFFALYYLASSAAGREKVFGTVALVFSATGLVICIGVLIMATRTLFMEPNPYFEMTGTIKSGRLCAFGNSNLFGFTCTAFLLVSIFGVLSSKGIMRVYYSLCVWASWFCLGLTGSRTSAIGVSASLGILLFSSGIKKFCIGKKDRMILRYGVVFIISVLATALAIESFALPTVIYHEVLLRFSGVDFYINTRTVHEKSGTVTDRSFIWIATVKSLFRNPRRLFLGISPISTEPVWQLYAGHHEFSAPHAHNAFLELARSSGILSVFIWVILLIRWAKECIRGLFDFELMPAFRYMAAGAAGIMIMGLMEPVPLRYSTSLPLSMVFFIICGFFSGLKRSNR